MRISTKNVGMTTATCTFSLTTANCCGKKLLGTGIGLQDYGVYLVSGIWIIIKPGFYL